jgi:ABC-type branched-subunit amino acid transport system substrate-binding protein/sugar lactone lactonase YvrE
MMIRFLIALLSAGAACAVVAAGASAASIAVKIGAVLPLSGTSATVGHAAENGAQLAVQLANSSKLVPGVTFSVVAKNDTPASGAPSGATGATQIKALIGNGQVAGAVAPFDTATALGELPLANRSPLATVSPSATDTCLTTTAVFGCTGNAAELSTVQPTRRITFFRVAPADALQGGALADFLFNTRRYKTAYVIDDTSPVGTGQATTFINHWQLDSGTLRGHASVAPTSTSYINLLTQVAALKPDVVVYTGGDATEGTLLRQQMLQVPGLSNTAFAATSSLHTAAFIQAVGSIGGPVWAVAPEPVLGQLTSATSFATRYQAKFGTPSTDAARGYDSAQALLFAVKAAIAGGAKPPANASSAATAFRKAVIAAVARVAFTGADGPIAFAPDGDLQQGPVEVDQLGIVAGALSWTPSEVVQAAAPTPAATLTPSALDFGWVPTGSSAALTLQLSNTGIVPFGVSSISLSGGGFQLASTTCTTANVLPAGQCAITIRFAPGAAGKATGKVTVVDSAGGTLQSATLSGTGVTAIALPAAVYVGNGANSSVRSFKLPLAANQAPASTLTGPDTQLDGTGAVALDKAGNLYVANADSETITVYPGNATSDTRPSAVLSGPDTGIANPTAITLDAQGRLYVANAAANTVTVYSPGASGDAAPIRTISGLFGPSGLVVDRAGNLWVANAPSNTLQRFGPSDTQPAATITGSETQLNGPQSLTLDAAGDVLVADEYSSAITAYAPTDDGDVGPSYSIAGSATGLDFPVGLDVDANGNLYVSNFFGNAITVYGAAERGNASPLATLSGSATGLSAPEHLAVSPPLAILTHRLPPARANQRYRARLIPSFGVGRYHWTIQRGRLPRGLLLGARSGLLTGVPHQAGTFHVRVRVTDHSHPASAAIRSLTLTVRAAKPSPNRHRRNH